MKKIPVYIIALLAGIVAACENEYNTYSDIPRVYLSGDPAQQATADSTYFSFRLLDFSIQEYDLNLVVHLAGEASAAERAFTLEIVDSLTNVPATAYSVGALVFPANAHVAVVPVTVKRAVEGLDLSRENARVTFRVTANEHFGEGVAEDRTYTLAWCDYLTLPPTWSVINFYIGPFSQARFKFIIDHTGYTDFEGFRNNYSMIMWLQGRLVKLLDDYNADPANSGRPEGWPYKNDNGEPLQFGQGLTS
ncbi:MAG: DUF4843 domain-containing protein [Odoribacteraceae bacterium]|jgi:hypothetical protein|nr:DUF4843 domain-containing protein [Odoribacteraceae bacterium]